MLSSSNPIVLPGCGSDHMKLTEMSLCYYNLECVHGKNVCIPLGFVFWLSLNRRGVKMVKTYVNRLLLLNLLNREPISRLFEAFVSISFENRC